MNTIALSLYIRDTQSHNITLCKRARILVGERMDKGYKQAKKTQYI